MDEDASRAAAGMMVVLLLMAAGCGGGGSGAIEQPGPGSGGSGQERPDPGSSGENRSLGDPRALRADATFGSVMEAMGTLVAQGGAESEQACLLGERRLGADVAPATNRLPGAAEDLDARISRRRTAVRVLTRWGQVGSGPNDLALVAATSLAASVLRTPGLVLFVTERFVYVRTTASDTPEAQSGPIANAELGAAIAGAVGRDQARWFVLTAEAGTRVERLRVVLAAVSAAGLSGAIAVPLPEGTRIPDEPTTAAATAASNMCPDGLPELAASDAVGDLASSAIVGALGPLRAAAADCMQGARGAAANGGRLTLALRIGPDGHVAHACARTDEAGDAAIRTCVLDALRRIPFTRPSPTGSVDVELPLVLAPSTAQNARPLCD